MMVLCLGTLSRYVCRLLETIPLSQLLMTVVGKQIVLTRSYIVIIFITSGSENVYIHDEGIRKVSSFLSF